MPGGVAASPRMKLEPGVSFLREVVTEWRKDNALSLGAALAFYALFSLAPLLLLIIAIGLLLFLSLVVSAVLAAVNQLLAEHLPVLSALLPPLNFLVSFLMITALFALIFKVLPDARMDWRDVWFGAAVTALLFTLGKTLIALYLGRTGRASVYGAAASLVVLLLWVYYSAQILLVGAEFTEVYSRRYGSRREYAAE